MGMVNLKAYEAIWSSIMRTVVWPPCTDVRGNNHSVTNTHKIYSLIKQITEININPQANTATARRHNWFTAKC